MGSDIGTFVCFRDYCRKDRRQTTFRECFWIHSRRALFIYYNKGYDVMSFIGNIEVQTFSPTYKFLRLNTDCDRCKFRHPMWLNKKQAIQFLIELASEIRNLEDTDDDPYKYPTADVKVDLED